MYINANKTILWYERMVNTRRIKEYLKKLLCKHDYELLETVVYHNVNHNNYEEKKYACKKCGYKFVEIES